MAGRDDSLSVFLFLGCETALLIWRDSMEWGIQCATGMSVTNLVTDKEGFFWYNHK